MALHNLKQLFGNEHKVSRSLLTSVKNEIRNVREHSMSWQLLVNKLIDCELAFTRMGKLEHLNSFETLEGLLKCFSEEIRDSWIKLSGKLYSEGLVPNFDNAIQMGSEKANYFSNLYSYLASNKDIVRSVKRNNHTLNNKGVLLISTPQGETFKRCPKCTGNHKLSDCAEFIKMSPDPRLTIVKSEGRRFLCLKGNHIVKECRSKWFCEREACRKRHHQLLHEVLIVDSNSKPKKSIVTSTNCNL